VQVQLEVAAVRRWPPGPAPGRAARPGVVSLRIINLKSRRPGGDELESGCGDRDGRSFPGLPGPGSASSSLDRPVAAVMTG
jgi:hypothetical protein